jgi:hypothetical protein
MLRIQYITKSLNRYVIRYLVILTLTLLIVKAMPSLP